MSNGVEVIFSYQRPDKKREESLIVNTGANSVYWNYNLNTQTYPTYGGEVVQILSCSISDVEIEGECRNYIQMEDIYNFFVTYMQFASQGISNKPIKYLGNPMRMRIPSRGWNLKLVPKSVPGFKLGTEVVAPSWKVTAQVFEDDDTISGQILSSIARKYYGTPDITIQQAMDSTSTLSEIGYYPDSGFVNPNMSLGDTKGAKPNRFDGKALKKAYESRGEAFRQIINTYIENDGKNAYGSLFDGVNYSSPYEKSGDGSGKTK